jgi:hypothetical protein
MDRLFGLYREIFILNSRKILQTSIFAAWYHHCVLDSFIQKEIQGENQRRFTGIKSKTRSHSNTRNGKRIKKKKKKKRFFSLLFEQNKLQWNGESAGSRKRCHL